ncbi:Dbl homology domain-containing protein, partial [Pelagophyceae sp. CCMP2097]
MVDDDEDVFVDALESHDVPTEQLRPSASPAELSAEDRAARAKEVRHRLKIFEEIFESEANYVRDLGVICHVFMAPIEKHDIMSREELDRIFSNVRELRQIHCELLSKLRQAERRRKDLLLGGKVEKAAQQMAAEYAAIFATMVPFLRAYASYCVTYPSAIELVRTLADSRPKLQKFLELVKHVPQCRGLDLASFLIKPPQRLCKYPLFFNDLLKSLNPEDSKDSVDV